jgi:hypothetical protein
MHVDIHLWKRDDYVLIFKPLVELGVKFVNGQDALDEVRKVGPEVDIDSTVSELFKRYHGGGFIQHFGMVLCDLQ